MNKITLTAALLVALALAACSKEETPSSSSSTSAPAAAATSQPVTTEAIEAGAQGFTVGSPMSARTVYVFYDAQCPHCSALWYAAKPLKSQAKFVWIPIRLLNDSSATQAAAILAAKDPVAAMDAHENSMMDHKGGIKPEGDVSAQLAVVKKNTELFNKFGFNSVPSLVTKNAQTGAITTHEGSMQTPDLAAFVGVQPPPPAQ
ncbi:MAG TPA: thioredoxin fold domain-containing protein [Ramlibacter sp.]|jgi:thiol:disulfide interchange protein DsbG|nr:thioredoxin fold domain-containing protein [Ramlibacter sp.]